jgi:hypothetical protein
LSVAKGFVSISARVKIVSIGIARENPGKAS